MQNDTSRLSRSQPTDQRYEIQAANWCPRPDLGLEAGTVDLILPIYGIVLRDCVVHRHPETRSRTLAFPQAPWSFPNKSDEWRDLVDFLSDDFAFTFVVKALAAVDSKG